MTTLKSYNQYVPIYNQDLKLIDTVENGTPVTVIRSPTYTTKYTIEYSGKTGYVSGEHVKKPKLTFGASENLNLKTNQLIDLGDDKIIQFQGKDVHVKYFSNHKSLIQSILSGMADNQISSDILSVTEQIFSGHNSFQWGDVSRSDRNELGKYLGELHYPFMESIKDKIPFAFPVSTSFGGVDSFLFRNEIIPISSKYGEGAPAAFIANIARKANPPELESSIFKNLCEINLNSSIRDILYTYSEKYVLPGHDNLYNNLKSGNIPVGLKESMSDCEPAVLAKFPSSVSYYICQRLRKDLENCPTSMTQIANILRENNYIQVNLNNKYWLDGQISYKIMDSSQYEIRLRNSKSSMSDLDCLRGIICYRLCPISTQKGF